MNPVLPELVAKIAESKIGLKESPPGSNKGPEIQEFFDADSYDPNGSAPGDSGYAWCAAFVCRIVQLAMAQGTKAWTFKRPTTPGAWALEAWSLAQDASTKTIKPCNRDIKRGDILVLKISHVCIATGPPDANGNVPTVDGNSNEAGSREGTVVIRKNRHYTAYRSALRFTV